MTAKRSIPFMDQMIDPQLQAGMAQRIHARTVSVARGHLPMVTHPAAVVALIRAAMAPARDQP